MNDKLTNPVSVKSPVSVEVAGLELSRDGRSLVREMSWKLPPGSFLAVTGPSGIGKTSLLTCLRGELEPTTGSVSFGDIAHPTIGVIFQHLQLTEELSVLTNVLCGKLGLYHWWQTLLGFPDDDKQKAFKIISDLGLKDLVHKPVKHISGGEKQRTAVARALLQDPDLVLADEPTSNLDPALADAVMTALKSSCKTNGRSVIAVLHDRGLVDKFADFELALTTQGIGWSFQEVEKR